MNITPAEVIEYTNSAWETEIMTSRQIYSRED